MKSLNYRLWEMAKHWPDYKPWFPVEKIVDNRLDDFLDNLDLKLDINKIQKEEQLRKDYIRWKTGK